MCVIYLLQSLKSMFLKSFFSLRRPLWDLKFIWKKLQIPLIYLTFEANSNFFQILEPCACENLHLGLVHVRKCVHTASNEEIKFNWILQLGADYFVRRGTYQNAMLEKKNYLLKIEFLLVRKRRKKCFQLQECQCPTFQVGCSEQGLWKIHHILFSFCHKRKYTHKK